MPVYDISGNAIITGKGSSVLYGKKWAVCGDSITSGEHAEKDENGNYKTYAWFIAERNNMTLYKDGISGTTMTNNGNQLAFSVSRYKNIPKDCDYITIWFGINDQTGTVGTIDDTENTTYYGAFNVVLTYLLNNMPSTTKIGLVASHDMASVKREAVHAVAKKYGLKVFDIEDDENIPYWHRYGSGVSEEVATLRSSQWFADGQHPNTAGYEYISAPFEAWLKTL